jgi:hypothetical protein
MRMDIGVNRILINNSKIRKLAAKAISVEDFTIVAQTVLAKLRVVRFYVQPAVIRPKESKSPKFVGDTLESFKDRYGINCADELQAVGDG